MTRAFGGVFLMTIGAVAIFQIGCSDSATKTNNPKIENESREELFSGIWTDERSGSTVSLNLTIESLSVTEGTGNTIVYRLDGAEGVIDQGFPTPYTASWTSDRGITIDLLDKSREPIVREAWSLESTGHLKRDRRIVARNAGGLSVSGGATINYRKAKGP